MIDSPKAAAMSPMRPRPSRFCFGLLAGYKEQPDEGSRRQPVASKGCCK
jgi:hypothetical protein